MSTFSNATCNYLIVTNKYAQYCNIHEDCAFYRYLLR